jgi:hypothetical protein
MILLVEPSPPPSADTSVHQEEGEDGESDVEQK